MFDFLSFVSIFRNDDCVAVKVGRPKYMSASSLEGKCVVINGEVKGTI